MVAAGGTSNGKVMEEDTAWDQVMEQRKSSNPLAVIAFSLLLVGIAVTAVMPWIGELTLPAIAAVGALLGIPALMQAQKGAGKRGLALTTVVCGGLAILLFVFLKIFRT